VNKTDAEILDLILNSDVKGIEYAFHKYYEPLCLHGLRYLRDRHKVEDLVQDLFHDLWKKRENINIKSSLSGYLKTSIRNRIINHAKSKRMDFAEEDEIKGFKVDEANTQQNMENMELEEYLHSVIEQLPEKCRMVFVMSRFEELSYKEIAEKLEISPKTVENQISKALKVLREHLTLYRENF